MSPSASSTAPPPAAEKNKYWVAAKPFVTGSLAGSLSTCVIQPMDMVKVRIQVGAAEGGKTSPLQIARQLMAEEGPRGFYKGRSFEKPGPRINWEAEWV